MYDEEETNEISDDKTCRTCGLRQYSDICANCDIPIEEDKEKKKEDEDEYDYRERR